MLCRHCGERKANMWRGLCNPCYRDPEIRELYPKDDCIGFPDVNTRTDPEPTDTRPGSEERIQVYEQRAANYQHMFHDDDTPLEDG